MPIYEYECPSCEGRFEELRTISERNQLPHCAGCGSKAVRVFSSSYLLSGTNPRLSKTQGSSKPEDDGIQILNSTFENVETGISLPEGLNVTIKGNKFKNVKTPVEFRKK